MTRAHTKDRYWGEKVWMRVRTSHLCDLFDCTPRTIRRWVKLGKIDPTDLEGIISAYNNRALLDKRRIKK